ncbi:MAG: Ig-like domain-containing protein [Patescibacteria group bacterium]
MDKKFTEFFGKAKSVAMSSRERRSGMKNLKKFMHSNPVRVKGEECHKTRMAHAYAQFLGQVKTLKLTALEKAQVFAKLTSFMRSHPVKTKLKKESGFDRILAISALYVPATAVLILFVMTRGDVDHHPWKQQIEPLEDTMQVVPMEEGQVVSPAGETRGIPKGADTFNKEEVQELLLWQEDDEVIDEALGDPVLRQQRGGGAPPPTSTEAPADVEENLEGLYEDSQQDSSEPMPLPRSRGRGKALPAVELTGEPVAGESETLPETEAQQGAEESLYAPQTVENTVPAKAVLTSPGSAEGEVFEEVEFIESMLGPTFESFLPASGSSNVKLDTHLFLTFSKQVQPNVGSVTVRRSNDHSIVESIFVTSLQVSGAGTTKITINLSKNLEQGIAYYIEVAARAFVDSEGNFSSEIKGAGTWYFETLIEEEPVSEEPSPEPISKTMSGATPPSAGEELSQS